MWYTATMRRQGEYSTLFVTVTCTGYIIGIQCTWETRIKGSTALGVTDTHNLQPSEKWAENPWYRHTYACGKFIHTTIGRRDGHGARCDLHVSAWACARRPNHMTLELFAVRTQRILARLLFRVLQTLWIIAGCVWY